MERLTSQPPTRPTTTPPASTSTSAPEALGPTGATTTKPLALLAGVTAADTPRNPHNEVSTSQANFAQGPLSVSPHQRPACECPDANCPTFECPTTECPTSGQTRVYKCPECKCPEFECPALECPMVDCPALECPAITCPELKCPGSGRPAFFPKKASCSCPPCAVLKSKLETSLTKNDRFTHHRKLICSQYFGVLDFESESLFRDALIDSGTYTLFCESLAKQQFQPRVEALTEKLKMRKIVSKRAEQMRMKALRELQRKVRTESTSLQNCRKRFPLDWHTCGMVCLNYSKYFCL